MTGDFPLYGFEGKAKPVYDLDSDSTPPSDQTDERRAVTSTERLQEVGRTPSHPFFQRMRDVAF